MTARGLVWSAALLVACRGGAHERSSRHEGVLDARPSDSSVGQRPAILAVDEAAVLHEWQGIWNLGADVVEIHGGSFHEWTPQLERDGDVTVLAPCEVQVGDMMLSFFALDHPYLGPGGFVRGQAAVVCDPDPYVLDEHGVCREWDVSRDGIWSSEPADCKWQTTSAGERSFVIDVPRSLDGGTEILSVRGDVIFDPRLVDNAIGPYRDLASAERAALSLPDWTTLALNRETFLDSVRSIYAWRALGRPIDGKRVEITAVPQRVDAGSTTLIDDDFDISTDEPPGTHEHTVTCVGPPSAAAVVGQKVSAAGTIHLRGADIELAGCRLSAP